MVKNIIITIVLLSSAYFFRLAFLSHQLIFLIQFGITGMMLLIILIQEIYGKHETMKLNFKYPVFLILTGVFLSMVVANAYHSQGYALTFWAQRFMYFYLFYFFLHVLKPDIKDLEKIILTLGILYLIGFMLQYALYPTTIFDVRQSLERGTIRIYIPGGTFMGFALYMCLDRFYRNNQMRYLFLVLMFFSVYILIGGRTVIAINALVIIASLLFSKIIRSRYLIYFLLLVSLIPIYFIFQDIFAELIAASEKESQTFATNVRIRATVFFLTEFFPNTLSYIFGNGQDHMGSIYGLRVNAYKVYHGFYQSDIGLIGDFSKYGLFFVIGALWLLFKAFKSPVKPEFSYIKFRLLIYILILPVSGFFTTPSSIAELCIIMYMIDISLHEQREISIENKSEAAALDQGYTGMEMEKAIPVVTNETPE
jgi:hypothetical protein